MSNELAIHYTTGQTLKAVIWGPDRRYRWNGTSMVLPSSIADNDASWQAGVVSLTEQTLAGGSTGIGQYVGDLPNTKLIGEHQVDFYNGLPARGDRRFGHQTVGVEQITASVSADDLGSGNPIILDGVAAITDAYVGFMAIVKRGAAYADVGKITSYDAGQFEITLDRSPSFAIVTGDEVVICKSPSVAITESVSRNASKADMSALPTQIWVAAERTLTGDAASLPPDVRLDEDDIHYTALDSRTRRLVARVRKWNGDDITQVYILSITYTIYLLDEIDRDLRTAVTGHEDVTIDKADVISDTLQTDARYANYNFDHIPDIAPNDAFPLSGREYEVQYTITPTGGGQVLPGPRFRVHVR